MIKACWNCSHSNYTITWCNAGDVEIDYDDTCDTWREYIGDERPSSPVKSKEIERKNNVKVIQEFKMNIDEHTLSEVSDEVILAYVRENFSPSDVFDEEQLKLWALSIAPEKPFVEGY